jgi:hypothetical protein
LGRHQPSASVGITKYGVLLPSPRGDAGQYFGSAAFAACTSPLYAVPHAPQHGQYRGTSLDNIARYPENSPGSVILDATYQSGRVCKRAASIERISTENRELPGSENLAST